MSKREMDKIVDKIVKDAKDKLGIEQPAKCGKCGFVIFGVTVLAGLIAIILYIKSKQDEDIEEYYEYFDDDLDDDEDNMYDDLDDDLDDDVEYLEIKNSDDGDDFDFDNDEE
ncbi:hypothetical protein [Candidatus Epulonipiscium viviparus]|uniref:hypothetical protein n=1 Tax=Candidatus Epulonipiscium viviparus TaxID=420336 RepID=UPI0027380B96|nr:hypothetical protein [Candidatus Epulopiscium viviparus]